MQVTHSVFSAKQVRVTAGYYEWPHLHLSLSINESKSYLDSYGENLYHSLNNSNLDWTSVKTVRNELARLAVPVSEKFLTDLALEYMDAKRPLIYRHIPDDDGEQLPASYYPDDDSDMPF